MAVKTVSLRACANACRLRKLTENGAVSSQLTDVRWGGGAGERGTGSEVRVKHTEKTKSGNDHFMAYIP